MLVYADGERVGPLPAVFEVLPGALARGGRARREGDPMTDGLLLIHAFPLDARMWEPQIGRVRRGARRGRPAPARVRRRARRRRGDDDGRRGRPVPAGRSTPPGSIGWSSAASRWAATSRSSSGGMARQRFAGLVLANTQGRARTRPRPPRAAAALAARLRSEGSDVPRRARRRPLLRRRTRPTSCGDRVRELIADQPAASIAAAAARDGRAPRLRRPTWARSTCPRS